MHQQSQMRTNDKPRVFQYSSLVMGSKEIPMASYSQKKATALTSAKVFSKKTDLLNAKFSKIKSYKVRTRNERPDIFLEGQQLVKNTQIWQQQIDLRYFEHAKQKLRRSTPNTFLKTQHYNRKTPMPRSTPACTESEEQNTSIYLLKNPRRGSSTFSKPVYASSNTRIYSTQRHQTSSKDSSTRRQFRQKIQQKIMQKTQLHLNQSIKAVQQFKRKQLFYLTQKDLSGIKTQCFVIMQHPSGQIITGSYYKKNVEIASLTKIMTFYVVMRIVDMYGSDIDKESIKIDGIAADISGTSAQLYEGDIYTVTQLLYGLMLPSGNDAAVALARWGGKTLGGDSKDFVAMMNKTANQIGMKSSTFGNPHGLPHPQNGSTAEDVAILVGKCLDYQIFREVVKCKRYRCWIENTGIKREVVWENTNKLLRREGFEGVKTGVTVAAGPCLASLYSSSGRTFIVILLRTNKMSRRFKQTRWLLCMSLRRMNFDGTFSKSLRQLNHQDPQFDSDNSEQEQQFFFDRNDLFQLDRRRRIIINDC